MTVKKQRSNSGRIFGEQQTVDNEGRQVYLSFVLLETPNLVCLWLYREWGGFMAQRRVTLQCHNSHVRRTAAHPSLSLSFSPFVSTQFPLTQSSFRLSSFEENEKSLLSSLNDYLAAILSLIVFCQNKENSWLLTITSFRLCHDYS